MSAIITREQLMKMLTPNDKEQIYREVLQEYTKQDILCRAEDCGYKITDEQADRCAYMYAYYGEYDCNLCYWDNIDNLIYNVTESH